MTAQGLIVFDVDSTFIEDEVIELLADATGRRDEVAAVTERAMRGEIDFSQSLRERVAVLADLPVSVIDDAAAAVTLTRGAAEVVAAAHDAGWIVALVSGGFTAVIEKVTAGMGIDEIRANDLETRPSPTTRTGTGPAGTVLSGRVDGEIVDRAAKAEHLRVIARSHGVDLAQTIAVGDGANDIDLLQAAAVGVAFCAKPALVPHADVVVDERDLMVVWKQAQRALTP
ncbi:phosphoserine phosphatase SerB [Brevibacterium yomogidense]|uniref:phosphoserine phosphatase SerB n=1 Tax=Brevibacterium yomogidense TaxID=946573 RepID=UPI0018DF7932|nr:phosphoserine phosphatase SerB [Brevibacterium yomogidense]